MNKKYSGMFSFANDEMVYLMLQMAKERHTEAEKEELTEKFKIIQQEEFIALCKEHQFEGIVAAFLKKCGYEMNEVWQEIYDSCYRYAKEKLEATKVICEKMHENGIEMIALKNGGILADIIDDPAKMPMGDVDSLVKKSDFLKSYEVMTELGFRFEYCNEYEIPDINNAYRDGDAEYMKSLNDSHELVYEVAWRVVAGRWMRPDCEPDTEENFSRSHYAKDSFIGVLSPEDNLLQVCIHTAKHSYVRAPGLRLNLDVERIVSNCEINWELFLEKVKKAHTKTAAYYSLYIPVVLFGTPVPQNVLDELRPSKSKQNKIEKMLSKAGFLHPKARKFSRIDFLLFQTALYDSFNDMWHTLYPNAKWLKARYNFSNNLKIPYYIFMRGLDIIGIRKKQK